MGRDNRNLLPNENSPEIVINGFGVLGGKPRSCINTFPAARGFGRFVLGARALT